MNKQTEPSSTVASGRTPHQQLIRDVVVFQFKLIVDGLRDLILVPTSLVVGIVSLLSGSDGKPGDQFYRLLAVGKQSERWIDLFDAVKNAPEGSLDENAFANRNIDHLIDEFEGYVRDDHKNGGLTAQAKERLDALLKAATRKRDA